MQYGPRIPIGSRSSDNASKSIGALFLSSVKKQSSSRYQPFLVGQVQITVGWILLLDTRIIKMDFQGTERVSWLFCVTLFCWCLKPLSSARTRIRLCSARVVFNLRRWPRSALLIPLFETAVSDTMSISSAPVTRTKLSILGLFAFRSVLSFALRAFCFSHIFLCLFLSRPCSFAMEHCMEAEVSGSIHSAASAKLSIVSFKASYVCKRKALRCKCVRICRAASFLKLADVTLSPIFVWSDSRAPCFSQRVKIGSTSTIDHWVQHLLESGSAVSMSFAVHVSHWFVSTTQVRSLAEDGATHRGIALKLSQQHVIVLVATCSVCFTEPVVRHRDGAVHNVFDRFRQG